MKNKALLLLAASLFSLSSARAEDSEFIKEVRRTANLGKAYWGRNAMALAPTAQANFKECTSFAQCFEAECKMGNPKNNPEPASRPFIMKAAKNPAKGTILMVHGLRDSPYTMGQTAEKLREEGYNVVAILLSGHGRPNGSKMDVDDWKLDIQKGAKLAKKFFPDGPLFGMGYSTGGGVLTRVVQEEKVKLDGMVLADPALELPMEARSFEANIGRCAIKVPEWIANTILRTGAVDKIPVEFVKENAEEIKALLQAHKTLRTKLDSENADDKKDPSRQAVYPNEFYEVRGLTDEINGRESLGCVDHRDSAGKARKKSPTEIEVPTLAFFTDSEDTLDNKAGADWVERNVTAKKKIMHFPGVSHRGLLSKEDLEGCRLKGKGQNNNAKFDEIPEAISAFLGKIEVKPDTASVDTDNDPGTEEGVKAAR